MGSSQLGRIERQIRTIEATNIRAMNLLLVLYPFIGRLQAGDGTRETVEEIVRWNYGLRIIFPHNSICLSGDHFQCFLVLRFGFRTTFTQTIY